MAGIYIHIPFCKQACHYCDFHFSTTLANQDQLVDALAQELILRKTDLSNTTIETIYFGGGTPSLLTQKQLDKILNVIYKHYKISKSPEITLEANPDDLDFDKLKMLKSLSVNRLSIGVQSFFDEDLKLMNRAHQSLEAKLCLEHAKSLFNNISIDLIYGIPGLSNDRWLQNIETALSFHIPHISSYALTVEHKTALEYHIKSGKIQAPNDEQANEQFYLLIDTLEKAGFVHYELSNFGKPNFFSENNSAYWQGKPYLGIGPSAHSYDGTKRSWNISNNPKYIKAIQENLLPSTAETLTIRDRYNEYIMTGLRTIWGVSLTKIANEFGADFLLHLEKNMTKPIKNDLLILNNQVLTTTKKGKFFTDGLASALFMV